MPTIPPPTIVTAAPGSIDRVEQHVPRLSDWNRPIQVHREIARSRAGRDDDHVRAIVANALRRDDLSELDRDAELIELGQPIRPDAGHVHFVRRGKGERHLTACAASLLPYLDEVTQPGGDTRGLHPADAGTEDQHPAPPVVGKPRAIEVRLEE